MFRHCKFISNPTLAIPCDTILRNHFKTTGVCSKCTKLQTAQDKPKCQKSGCSKTLTKLKYQKLGYCSPCYVKLNNVRQKETIPPALRSKVWDHYIGDDCGKTRCLQCEDRIISMKSYDCAHILSEANDGKTELSNLVPMCHQCNMELGTRPIHPDVVKAYHDFKANRLKQLQAEYTRSFLENTITSEKIDRLTLLQQWSNDDISLTLAMKIVSHEDLWQQWNELYQRLSHPKQDAKNINEVANDREEKKNQECNTQQYDTSDSKHAVKSQDDIKIVGKEIIVVGKKNDHVKFCLV